MSMETSSIDYSSSSSASSQQSVLSSSIASKPPSSTAYQLHTSYLRTLTSILHEYARPYVFRSFADPSSQCREVAIEISTLLLQKVSDVSPVLPYLFPAIQQRFPEGLCYDSDANLFVHNVELHDAYRRGKAVERQDKATAAVSVYAGHTGLAPTASSSSSSASSSSASSTASSSTAITAASAYIIMEPSEEVRLGLISLISSLVHTSIMYSTAQTLYPYFSDIILIIEYMLHDPFVDVRLKAFSTLLTLITQTPSFTLGLRVFAIGLARSIFPSLRHKHARCRQIAVDALAAVVAVPNKDKCKGAGTGESRQW